MNRFFIALCAVSFAFAAINPNSEQNVTIPSVDGMQAVDALVTLEFGVVAYSTLSGAVLAGFSTGSSFEFNNAQNLTIPGCNPQLLNVDDNADTFLVFCTSSNGSFSMVMVKVDDNGFTNQQEQSYNLADGQSVQLSASAFVTKQGNVYIGLSDSEKISILEFSVASFNAVVKIPDVAAALNGNGNSNNTNGTEYELVDLHSLPFDSGVSVILTDSSDAEYFAFIYFNGTSFNLNIPQNQNLVFVGRHRGSSFGYTIGNDYSGAYAIVTAWDLSDHTISNTIQIKGTVVKTSGHFATDEEAFVYSSSGVDGYIYELPYSEFGFLPNSVNYVVIAEDSVGNLADGDDGTYIYAFDYGSDDSNEFSRWTF